MAKSKSIKMAKAKNKIDLTYEEKAKITEYFLNNWDFVMAKLVKRASRVLQGGKDYRKAREEEADMLIHCIAFEDLAASFSIKKVIYEDGDKMKIIPPR